MFSFNNTIGEKERKILLKEQKALQQILLSA